MFQFSNIAPSFLAFARGARYNTLGDYPPYY